MRNELTYIEQIEKYLVGAFSPEEKALFEAKMSTSMTLTHDVLVHKELMDRVKVNAFTNDVKMFHQQFVSTTRSGWFVKGLVLNCVLGLTMLGISLACVSYFDTADKNPGPYTKILQPVSTESQPGGVQAGQAGFVQTDSTALKEETVCKNKEKKDISAPNTGNSKQPLLVDMVEEKLLDDTISKKVPVAANYINRGSRPAYLQPYFNSEEVYASKANTIKMKNSGSVIRIPENSMVHKNGKPVHGKVQIKYREFRDAADMAFSGIPMTFHEDGEDKQMNSLGMFEIRAYQNGEELALANGKSIAVDYVVTEKLDSAYFFSLNDSTQKWDKECSITPVPYGDQGWYTYGYAVIHKVGIWQHFLNIFRREEKDRKDYSTVAYSYSRYGTTDTSWARGTEELVANRSKEANFIQMDSAQLANYTARQKKVNANYAANAYIVNNLMVSKFGVHNCDQVNKLRNKVEILATYVDSSGNAIDDMTTLVVIDRNYNNAMTFAPQQFSCNRAGKNMLLLTGGDGRIYAVKEKEFKNMQIQKSGKYKFTVHDVTNKVSSRSEFKQFLGLKK